jgi:hypothetical protein
MAVIGFICLTILGFLLIVDSLQSAIGWYALSGRITTEYFFFIVPLIIGGLMLWYAFSNMPFTIFFAL